MTDSCPRIFHLITRLLKGGAEAKTTSTVRGLSRYDFTVGYGASFDPNQVSKLEAAGVGTRQFPLIRHYNPVTMVPAVLSVARYLQRNEFEIVHTHSTEAGIIGRLAAAIAGVPHVVHTVHGVPFASDRNPALNQFVLQCERLAARYTDRIVTNADVIADEYLERGIGTPSQYRTIYSGIDLNRFQDASPATGLPGSRPRVVMVGRLETGKGIDVLLEAAGAICSGGASICIVGDGSGRASLEEKITERGLDDCVYLTGYRSDIPRILAASDVLVHPSYREGTPRVITEAMTSGLPVVATDIAGIPEQVQHGETGYLITTGDAAALQERVLELLEQPERRTEMGAAGRERATRFSERAMLSDVDAVYRELLGETPVVSGRGP